MTFRFRFLPALFLSSRAQTVRQTTRNPLLVFPASNNDLVEFLPRFPPKFHSRLLRPLLLPTRQQSIQDGYIECSSPRRVHQIQFSFCRHNSGLERVRRSERFKETWLTRGRSSNHSFAVHKANLARSPVFRDMFDFPAAPPTDNDATGDAEGNEEEAGRAMKRIRLEKEAGGVPELKTEESRAILEVALSFFYNDEDQYDPGELRGLSVTVEHRSVHQPSLVQVLRFFDKFDLRSGRTAVVMCLP